MTDPCELFLENVFRVTLRRNCNTNSADDSDACTFLPDTHGSGSNPLSVDNLQDAVFERLLLLAGGGGAATTATDNSQNSTGGWDYLVNCSSRLSHQMALAPAALRSQHERIQQVIVQSMSTVIQQPALCGMEDLSAFYHSLRRHLAVDGWFDDIFDAATRQLISEEADLLSIFREIFEQMQRSVGATRGSLSTLDRFVYDLSLFMSSRPVLAETLVQLSEVPAVSNNQTANRNGVLYCRVPLGSLLWPSALNPSLAPTGPAASSSANRSSSSSSAAASRFPTGLEFFQSPLNLSLNSVGAGSDALWTAQRFIAERVHRVFENILRCGGRARQLLLRWIASCLQANSCRNQLWNTGDIDGAPAALSGAVPDGFAINLCAVLLRLALPFCKDLESSKLLGVDPVYCAAPVPACLEQQAVKWQHLNGLSEDTCLVSRSDESADNMDSSESDNNNTTTAGVASTSTAQQSTNIDFPASFNFRTECFFLCHKAIQMGLKNVQDRLSRLNGDLSQMQRLYQDTLTDAAADMDPETAGAIQERFSGTLQLYLSMRAALFEPSLVDSANSFLAATAVWLTQQAIRPANDSALTARRPVVFPLADECHPALACIPELLVDNLISHLLTLGRFGSSTPGVAGSWTDQSQLDEHAFTFIVVFMGSTERMRNPHLRANVAACLETMLPEYGAQKGLLVGHYGHQRERLFVEHPLAEHVARSLLHVFVSIEMTGQSVQFEEKFNYRRPMYVIMKYLWALEQHRQAFVKLSEEAEREIDSAQPPIFLRFINLLINDAVFLLDESLSYTIQLRDQVQHRQSDEFRRLSFEQRQRQDANFRHMGQISRFHNIMGRETIGVLQMLTSGVQSIFVHPSLVDRVAAMLNYFLLQLVGPKRRELKVKDADDYEFRPGEVVKDICRIYINLRSDNFCSAVGADERSYSPQLFIDAVDVLGRIGAGALVPDVEALGAHVSNTGAARRAEEDLALQAPERFLDPIMSTLMTDPVTLPSSGIVCDRSTIARHILSDQTDPFNRQPLTMDMVLPNTDIKQQIEEWRRQKLAEKHK